MVVKQCKYCGVDAPAHNVTCMRFQHPETFKIIDTGKKEVSLSGMARNSDEGKVDYEAVLDGPMYDRWAEHLTKGKRIYPDDPETGTANWLKADSAKQLWRFRKSAVRHFRQWLRGDVDEDHAAAVYFNINGFEYVKERLERPTTTIIHNNTPVFSIPLDPNGTASVSVPDATGYTGYYDPKKDF